MVQVQNAQLKQLESSDDIFICTIGEEHYRFYDKATSRTIESVARELNSEGSYNFKKFSFSDGDVVIDIGANVGVVSILMAICYPQISIFAIEPDLRNYHNLLRNIEMYELENIKPFNLLVNSTGDEGVLYSDPLNSGGSSVHIGHLSEKSYSRTITNFTEVCGITLSDFMIQNEISRVQLLKIDCEGSEYEILESLSRSELGSIQNIIGELHTRLDKTEEDMENLLRYCKDNVTGDVDFIVAE
jgi:FkbM family methyltransferase